MKAGKIPLRVSSLGAAASPIGKRSCKKNESPQAGLGRSWREGRGIGDRRVTERPAAAF